MDMVNLPVFSGRKLRQAREKVPISRRDLAAIIRKRMGRMATFSEPTIRNHETDRTQPDYNIVALYADILGVEVGQLTE